MKLNKEENSPNSRSVEHLIPNSLTLTKRNNSKGDFYACKKCNSHKSKMDNLIGKISKFQSFDNKLATSTMVHEYTKEYPNKSLLKTFNKIKISKFGIHGRLPFDGNDIYLYMEYLGKGQFLKKTGKIYMKSKYIMTFIYRNKEENMLIANYYKKLHGTNNFEDLKKNKYSEIINDGECIIYSKNIHEYMFVLHNHTVIQIKIHKYTNKNKRLALKNRNKILKEFSFNS